MYSTMAASLQLLSKNSGWVPIQTWLCLQFVANKYLNKKLLYLYLDGESPPPRLWPSVPVYLSKEFNFQNHIETDFILVVNDISVMKMQGVHNKLVIVTQNLDSISELWENYRLLHILVLYPQGDDCLIYTWSPNYNKNAAISLKLLGIWNNGKIDEAINLFPNKPINFFQSLKITSTPYPLFSYISRDGPEDKTIKVIAEKIGFHFEYIPLAPGVPFYQKYNPDGTLTGILNLLYTRSIDITYGCIFLLKELTEYGDFLHSYAQEDISWSMAAPKPSAVSTGIYSGFDSIKWLLISIVFILYTYCHILVFQNNSQVSSVLFVVRLTLSQGYGPSPRKLSAKILITFYSLYILHITSFYQSTLLINLFQIQYENNINSLDEAVIANFRIVASRTFAHLVSSHSAWELAKNNGKVLIIEDDSDPSFGIEEGKTLILGAKHLQKHFYQNFYAGIPYQKRVKFLKESVYSYHVSIYMPICHPMVPVIRREIQKIVEGGLFDGWYKWKKWLEYLQREREINKRRPLKIENLLLVYLMILIMFTLSTIIFFIEVIFGKLKRKC